MSVTLLQNAGIFRAGATFRTLDWAITCHGDGETCYWPSPSRWLWESRGEAHRVDIIGGIAKRDDGAVLHTNTARYEWRQR